MSNIVLKIMKDVALCDEDDNIVNRLREYVNDLIVTVESTGDSSGFVLKDRWVVASQTFGSMKNQCQIITQNGISIDGEPMFDMNTINLALIEAGINCSSNQMLTRNCEVTSYDMSFRFEAVKGRRPDIYLMEEVTGSEKHRLLKKTNAVFEAPEYKCGCPIVGENGNLQYITCYTIGDYYFCIPRGVFMQGIKTAIEEAQ